jgi:hypothetical protein
MPIVRTKPRTTLPTKSLIWAMPIPRVDIGKTIEQLKLTKYVFHGMACSRHGQF